MLKKQILRDDERGVTLIELLASFTLLTLIGLLIFSVFFTGVQAYERTMEENRLRDEADIIMSHFINEFFTMRTGDIEQGNERYIVKTNGKITGFKDGAVFVDGKEITHMNSGIQIGKESLINEIIPEEGNDDIFEVVLVLKSKKTDQTLQVRSIFRIIPDGEEKSGEASK